MPPLFKNWLTTQSANKRAVCTNFFVEIFIISPP
jgi:hypothetical protein